MLLFLLGNEAIGQNLIPNGSFEEYSGGRFTDWYFDHIFNASPSSDAKDGNQSVRVYAVGTSFYPIRLGETKIIDIEGGAEYEYSVWYKGETGNERVIFTLSWFDSSGSRIRNEISSTLNAGSLWQEYKKTLTAPSAAVKASVSVNVRNQGNALLVDAMSLIKKGSASGVLTPPSGFGGTAFQREIALRWEGDTNKQIRWEIVVGSNPPIKVSKNNYVVENLQPNQNYTIKIRTVKGSETSEFVTQNFRTEAIDFTENDLQRIPHLRTIEPYGKTGRTISLYYNDLWNQDAQFLYWIDGNKVTPTNSELTFPKSGTQKLKIQIKETANRIWDLDYTLRVE